MTGATPWRTHSTKCFSLSSTVAHSILSYIQSALVTSASSSFLSRGQTMVHVMRHQDLNRFNLPGTSARNYHPSGPRPPKREPPRRQ